MSLQHLPLDILYTIATYLLPSPSTTSISSSSPPPSSTPFSSSPSSSSSSSQSPAHLQPIFEAFLARRTTFAPLVRVCRSFRAAFEPLLYHTLSARVEYLPEERLLPHNDGFGRDGSGAGFGGSSSGHGDGDGGSAGYGEGGGSAGYGEGGAGDSARYGRGGGGGGCAGFGGEGKCGYAAYGDSDCCAGLGAERRLRLAGAVEERDVWRALRRGTGLGRWVRRVEIDWDDRMYGKDVLETMEKVLCSFTGLIELHLGPSHASRIYPDPWKLDLLRSPSLANIRRLVLNCQFDARMLPRLFFLPRIEELKLSCFDPRKVDAWKPPEGEIAGKSPVTTLEISAVLSTRLLEQVLTWPERLFRFKHDYVGILYKAEWDLLNTTAIEKSLRPFQHTLRSLELRVTNDGWYLNKPDFINSRGHHAKPHSDDAKPQLSFRHFTKLSHLSVATVYFFAVPGQCYCNTRTNILPRLPPNIITLSLLFGTVDRLDHYLNPPEDTYTFSYSPVSIWFEWLRAPLKEAYLFLPTLRNLDLVEPAQGHCPWFAEKIMRVYGVKDINLRVYTYTNRRRY